jgi:hypothetical protein
LLGRTRVARMACAWAGGARGKAVRPRGPMQCHSAVLAALALARCPTCPSSPSWSCRALTACRRPAVGMGDTWADALPLPAMSTFNHAEPARFGQPYYEIDYDPLANDDVDDDYVEPLEGQERVVGQWSWRESYPQFSPGAPGVPGNHGINSGAYGGASLPSAPITGVRSFFQRLTPAQQQALAVRQ